MTLPRSKLVDVSVSRWYHCISRCVRRARLLGEGEQVGERKAWIERRLEELNSIFAVSVGGFAVLDNHLHVLLRLDPDEAKSWSDAEVVERWFRLYPPRGTDRKPLPPAKRKELLEERLKDTKWLAETRERLSSLGWFMKSLKEPLSRMVNKAENCTGAFFEGRFKSIAVLDEEALLSVCAYIDLNPVAAGIAKTPEESEYTSVKARVDHVRRQGREEDLRAALKGSVAASAATRGLEDALWLVPIEDCRELPRGQAANMESSSAKSSDANPPSSDSSTANSKSAEGVVREGMVPGFTLGNYLLLVDYTGRLLRNGKASVSSELASILDRIGSSAEAWQARVARLRGGRLLGRFIAGSREAMQRAAERLGVSHLANLKASPG